MTNFVNYVMYFLSKLQNVLRQFNGEKDNFSTNGTDKIKYSYEICKCLPLYPQFHLTSSISEYTRINCKLGPER